MIQSDVSTIDNLADKKEIMVKFIKDTKIMYNLFEDIELLDLYVTSDRYKLLFNNIISERNKKPKTMKAPRSLKKDLTTVASQEEYVKFVFKQRQIYKSEMVDLVEKTAIKSGKMESIVN